MNLVNLKSAVFDSVFSLKIAQTHLPLLALPRPAAEAVVAATAETAVIMSIEIVCGLARGRTQDLRLIGL